jgi:crotonobetainyl-CoA:carnitine CoA-transferase CaiB-like acyl-CoA transferase
MNDQEGTRLADPANAPLPLRVLSLARGVGAAFTARQLSDLGATTSWWRWADGRPGDWPRDDVFLSFFTEGVEVVSEHRPLPDLLATLPGLIGEYDVLITDFDADEQSEGELYELLAPYNPALVVANLSHYGRTGPYAGWVGDELTDYALGGYWGLAGHPDREPLRVPGHQAQFHGGLNLSLAAAAAVREARRTGRGQEVDAAAYEAMLGSHWDATVTWTHTGGIINRTGPDLYQAVDGYVFFYKMVFFPNLSVLIGQPELAGDPRWATVPEYVANAPQFWDLVETWCADKTTTEITEAAQALRLPVVTMANAQTLLDEPTLAERGYFRDINGLPMPGRPILWSVDWPQPVAGTRLAEQLAADSSRAQPPIRLGTYPVTNQPARPSAGPLAGVRVLELSNNWAGPLAGRHLGDLGAEVIKIEQTAVPMTRAGGFYPGNVPGRRYWNRSGYFNEMNRNKRSIALNLASEQGREIFLALAAEADVVLENNSSRVMPKLGIGYDTLRELNPKIVMGSISGFGATGDRRNWVAFGSNIEAATGLAATTGYDAETPYRTGTFVADPIAGTQISLAIVAALEKAERDGHGAHLDLSLIEATLPFMTYSFARLHSTGELLARAGNAEPWDAPTGAYPTDGPDEWIAIAVRTDEQWAALATLAGLNATLGPTLPDRLANRDEIDAQLRGWTASVAQYEAVRRLQGIRVAAAPILKNPQFHTDPHLYARDAFIPIDHPDTGVLPYPGFPWRFTATPPSVRSAAPRFAEGNNYVFSRLAGLDADQIAKLYADGISTEEPTGLNPT